MSSFMLLAAALFGAIVGSFCNALSFRLGTGRVATLFSPTSSGRSRCMRCGHVLSPRDLVPVFSWLFLRGRCRYCRARISMQYPLVEAAAAVLAAGVYIQSPDPLHFVFWLVVWMTLLFTLVYDLRHKIIPLSCSVLLGALGLVYVWTLGFSVWSLLAGPLVAAPLLLLSLVSGGRWMGWGDGLLELGLGWLLGVSAGASALAIAFWSGAAVGIVLMIRQSGYTMKSELPFAPFLILGAGVAYFLHVDFFQTLPALFL